MTDIVERLNAVIEGYSEYGDVSVERDARSEIIRLRADLAVMKEACGAHHVAAMREAQRADQSEAREAKLREVVDLIDWVENECFGLFPEGDEDEGFLISYAVTRGNEVVGSAPTIFDAIDQARTAMSQKGGDA
ncbi:MAG: hypothetical protein KJ731_21170 [Alphaproteobacteria bacterium]|uniref:Uncharacterized protein n=1 Tax=viral metagenome TaxID=1070528 RepID=A0A6M3JI77_9ZZZZ|nr:hypothetical protein [Alphaproteobacteria bacterium]MBU1280297.1 hypothetical protein [Alphaproteobacteria bacterium]MBU1573035.1 hypothetical protein [Alphaproteobacteria bacterium]MBU1830962.1 hypothetical protein [Alphaproteobacteria bacterium]MBU2079995.1 hypothetical protein [Alphaproteobacteria bacterium]